MTQGSRGGIAIGSQPARLPCFRHAPRELAAASFRSCVPVRIEPQALKRIVFCGAVPARVELVPFSVAVQASLPGHGGFPFSTCRRWKRRAIIGGPSWNGWYGDTSVLDRAEVRRKWALLFLAEFALSAMRCGRLGGTCFKSLSPLPGSASIRFDFPRLAAWAAFFRRLAAHRRGFALTPRSWGMPSRSCGRCKIAWILRAAKCAALRMTDYGTGFELQLGF